MNILAEILSALGLLQIAPVLAPPAPLYAGMDTTAYPGKGRMSSILTSSNIVWTGMYIDSPDRVPGELARNSNIFNGHFGRGLDSWMPAWRDLYPPWGLLPIYWGQQDPTNADGPHDLRTFIAVANAKEAATKANNAGIPVGAVIYLDWEIGAVPIPTGIAYCRAWFQQLAELGYRPGVYCHPPASRAFRLEYPQLFVWNVNIAPFGGFKVVGGRLVLATPRNLNDARGERPDLDSVARQWRFGLSPPAHNPIPGFPQIDADASTVGDPSFPERRVQPALVRRGKLTAAIVDVSTLAIFAVRKGAVVLRMWTTATPGAITSGPLPDHTLLCNPWSPHSALQRGASGELAVIARSSAAGTADNAWQVHVYRRRGTTWTFDQNINGTIPVEPLLGVRLVSRAPNIVEAFFVTNDGTNRAFVVSCVDLPAQADGQTWSAPVVVNAPAGMQPSLVGAIGAASRAAATIDVFVVARMTATQPWQLFWNSSSVLGTWPTFSVPGDPSVTLHPFSSVAAVSRGPQLLDVFAIAKGVNDTDWTVYRWWWDPADSWGVAANFHTQPIADTVVRPQPASKVAAVSRSQQFIDLFIVGDADGLLYNAFWDGGTNTWSHFRRVGVNNVRVDSIDGAFSRTANSVDVVVTGRDGNVYVSSWNSFLAGYSDLLRVTSLDPV